MFLFICSVVYMYVFVLFVVCRLLKLLRRSFRNRFNTFGRTQHISINTIKTPQKYNNYTLSRTYSKANLCIHPYVSYNRNFVYIKLAKFSLFFCATSFCFLFYPTEVKSIYCAVRHGEQKHFENRMTKLKVQE